MLRKRRKVLLSGQRIMKGLLVTPNRTVTVDTHHHAHLDQTKSAEGPGLDQGLDQEGLEQVHLIPDQRDPEVTEDHARKGLTIMSLTGDHTGVLHVEKEDVLVLALTELGTVLTLRMTTGRRGQGQVILADRLLIQAYIKSQNHLPIQNLRKPPNLQIPPTPQSWIKEHNHQSLKGLQSDYQTLIPSASALLTWTPITVNLALITSQRPIANPPLPVHTPTLRQTKNAQKAVLVTLRPIIKGNHRPLTKALALRRTIKTLKRNPVGRTQSR